MTTKIDNYKKRKDNPNIGEGRALSSGTSSNGMQDASGEYPRREYNLSSSINKAALGLQVNELYTGGGEIGVPLGLSKQIPSQYPFNQVDETPSGHSIEMDDTPGGERILIRHNLGSGVELRADGTVVISALNNKVEVTGGDQTVIVEGHGNLVYNGNLNLKVSGDMNVEVGGDYNLDVAGNSTENIGRNYRKQVTGDTAETFLKTKYEKILGTNVSMKLGGNDDVFKGDKTISSTGNLTLASAKDVIISGKKQIDIISKETYITGKDKLKVQGTYGMIGGAFVRYTGQTYSGAQDQNDSDNIETAIFHGALKGTADKAIHSSKANSSVLALAASTAVGAVGTSAQAAAFISAASTITGVLAINDLMATFTQETEQGHVTVEPKTVKNIFTSEIPQTTAMSLVCSPTNLEQTLRDVGKPLQNVIIDENDLLRKESKGAEHYDNNGSAVFFKEPTIGEIRSAFRNRLARVKGGSSVTKEEPSNVAILLIAEGKLNPQYLNKEPKTKIGRKANNKRKRKL